MAQSRRAFLRSLGIVGVSAGLLPLAACGDYSGLPFGENIDSGSSDTGVSDDDSGSCAAVGSTITQNHGHVLMVSIADVTAGAARTYDIRGTSVHPHTVTLSAAHMTTLRGGSNVTVTSSIDAGHNHDVTVMCV